MQYSCTFEAFADCFEIHSASFFLEMLKALHRTRRGGYNSRFGDVTQRYMHLKKNLLLSYQFLFKIVLTFSKIKSISKNLFVIFVFQRSGLEADCCFLRIRKNHERYYRCKMNLPWYVAPKLRSNAELFFFVGTTIF